MYCRNAYANIIKFSRDDNFPESFNVDDDDDPMATNMIHSNVLLLREFDLENLTFLIEDAYSRD